MMGTDVKYMPKTLVKLDQLFGEDVLIQFNSATSIEMYLENVQGYEGAGDTLAKFGVIVKDQLTFHVASRRFAEVFPSILRPKEGDLIFYPLTKKIFEIRFVEDESQFFPLATLPSYKLKCEAFDFSMEQIDTGDDEIDDINLSNLKNPVDPNHGDNQVIETEGDAIRDITEENIWGDM